MDQSIVRSFTNGFGKSLSELHSLLCCKSAWGCFQTYNKTFKTELTVIKTELSVPFPTNAGLIGELERCTRLVGYY